MKSSLKRAISVLILSVLTLVSFKALYASQIITSNYAPYDLAKINYLSGNYLQGLLDSRCNVLLFAHDMCGDDTGIGALNFVDDTGRAIWAFEEEDRYTPVVRLELIKTLVKGIIQARIPNAKYKYFFTREGRKGVNLVWENNGEITMRWLQDNQSPFAVVKFETQTNDGAWYNQQELVCKDTKIVNTAAKEIFKRDYFLKSQKIVAITGKTYSSVLDKAPELSYKAENIADLKVVIESKHGSRWGELVEAKICLPDRNVYRQSEFESSLTLYNPNFNYLIKMGDLRGKESARWDSPSNWGTYLGGYVVVWTGNPTQIEFKISDLNIDTLSLYYKGTKGEVKESLWIMPVSEFDPQDIDYLHDIAINILSTRKMGMKGYLPVRTSCGYAGSMLGLASGAYVLNKYKDPYAPTAIEYAVGTMNAFIEADKRGLYAEYLDNLILGAYYLIEMGYKEYMPWVEIWADRLMKRCRDGSGVTPWPETTLRNMLGMKYAYEITGNKKYQEAYKKTRGTFKVGDDPESYYWKGKRCSMSGASPTTMFFQVLGHEGGPDVQKFIDQAGDYFRDFGYVGSKSKLKGLAYGCSDMPPYVFGYSAKGLNIKTDKKIFLNLNEFVEYDANGNVTIIDKPLAYNPYYPVTSIMEKHFKKEKR